MVDTFDFLGGALIGTFIGSLVTLIYHVREIRHEARQHYFRISMAQAEVVTLERTLEIHRCNPVTEFTQPPQDSAEPERRAANSPPLIPAWSGNLESPIGMGITSNGPWANREKLGSDIRKSQVIEECKFW
jgi:hypothetical protein